MSLAGFPTDAVQYLITNEKILFQIPDAEEKITQAVSAVCTDGAEFLPLMEALAQESGVDRYAVDMLILLRAAIPMRESYRARGISDEVYRDTISDLRNKLIECKKLKGEWGTFVAWWLADYFRLKRFALGRMQYEIVDYEGKKALNCHIPSGSPLEHEAVMASLRKAYEFFPQVHGDGVLTVVCGSWILYPPHRELFLEGSNLRRFVDLFTVTQSNPDPQNRSLWVIFYQSFSEGCIDSLPTDTSLRRRFVEYLRAGNSMGYGKGYLRFDGEKII
jgi:hypothetical protein